MRKKKNIFQEDSPKAFQNRKDSEVVFQITFNNFKQILLMKDEAIHKNFMEIKKYKCIYAQTLPSPVQDSVENDKVKLTMSQEKPLAWVLLPLIPPLAQKLLQKKFS